MAGGRTARRSGGRGVEPVKALLMRLIQVIRSDGLTCTPLKVTSLLIGKKKLVFDVSVSGQHYLPNSIIFAPPKNIHANLTVYAPSLRVLKLMASFSFVLLNAGSFH